LTYPSEKILVNWDDDIPNIWKTKSHVPNHQPVNEQFSIAMFNYHPVNQTRFAGKSLLLYDFPNYKHPLTEYVFIFSHGVPMVFLWFSYDFP
jgi:hypothetical protein